MAGFFETPIEFLKGVGPQKASLLNNELKIFTYGDLLQFFPFRYEDRTRFYSIRDLNENLNNVQFKGILRNVGLVGPPRRQRLVASIYDETGEIELVWFKGAKWVQKRLQIGQEYIIFGKPNRYGRKLNIAHPEFEPLGTTAKEATYLQPVYPSTEKLRERFLDSKGITKLQKELLRSAFPKIYENLPRYLINDLGLISKAEAMLHIHFPRDNNWLTKARYRLKFEELFYVQIQLLKSKHNHQQHFPGKVFESVSLLTTFYENHLPFELTNAQKRVVKEIHKDMKSGVQMNRLVQGDVGSGKTIVAFLAALLVIDANAQATLMAPTEILAQQHYVGLKQFADLLGIRIALLTGSTKASERTVILRMLRDGDLQFIVGTHALIEDRVQFKDLGLAIIDEQHRFGVAQRSRLWSKTEELYPHVLVMTATPIPRTLAMALYGDLDISVIDELPKGRKPIKTTHSYDSGRLKVNGFIKKQIEEGRQAYIVYPLIEESEKLDLKDLMDGYESIQRAFPGVPVSIVHGKMSSDAKDYEMSRFKQGETKIMVSTTVIEVGVDVPNASLMVIENAERFGLAQLHQLRGRVGRGADQSYCILISKYELSQDGRTRLDTMVRTNNGFEIADVDLKLRGPGDLLGTQQSGILDFLLADLSTDSKILQVARQKASEILDRDPTLSSEENQEISEQVNRNEHKSINWSRIS